MKRPPLPGYNHNVRHGGRIFHVQTEDSGPRSPYVATHLFHEGTICASMRTDYESHVDDGAVQKLMQAQHKAMLSDLRAGRFDAKITAQFGAITEERSADPAPHLDGASETVSSRPALSAQPERAAQQERAVQQECAAQQEHAAQQERPTVPLSTVPSVVVARPAIIVSDVGPARPVPHRRRPEPPPPPLRGEPPSPPPRERTKALIPQEEESPPELTLDQVVLSYLTRKRDDGK